MSGTSGPSESLAVRGRYARGVYRRVARAIASLVVTAAVVAPVLAQLPPIGIRVEPRPGWQEVSPEGTGAAYVFRKLGADGKVAATFNVVIVESEGAGGSVLDSGVAEGLEAELLQVLPGARVTDRTFLDVGRFKAFRLTVEAVVSGKPKVFRQTTIDVRRGVVTTTAAIDAAAAAAIVPEIDTMVSDMSIDAALP
jgi:hypothetical protein